LNVSVANVKEPKFATHAFQHACEVFFVGVGYEQLSKVISADQSDDAFHPFRVQLVKQVVNQQNGQHVFVALQKTVLTQLQGNQKTFVLPLRPNPFDGKTVQLHEQLILVDAF
jgi:hypothetical protein